jgi:hypothetical protein
MVIADPTHEWVLRQHLAHGRKYGKTLSAAKLSRAVLAGCAEAQAPLGEQATEEDIVALVAGAFKHTPAASEQA